jgi:uncharacterized protein (TIGR02391 family)
VVIDLSPDVVVGLPVDELGLQVLADMDSTGPWSEHNYLLDAAPAYSGEALDAIAEAVAWLRARALIARTPGKTAGEAIFITRTGRRVLADGLIAYQATETLQGGVHRRVEEEARPQFLIGKYELGVFSSMKAVEIRVRDLAGFGHDLIGVPLMNAAFGPTGPLTDTTSPKGEQEGTRGLFAGAYAVLRNPSGHREVDYDDVAEAGDAVHTASLLMRVLDRIEARLAGGSADAPA